jgi:hypothetical protein
MLGHFISSYIRLDHDRSGIVKSGEVSSGCLVD